MMKRRVEVVVWGSVSNRGAVCNTSGDASALQAATVWSENGDGGGIRLYLLLSSAKDPSSSPVSTSRPSPLP